MQLITEILLDILGAKSARKNALKLKELRSSDIKGKKVISYRLINTYKDYLLVYFPTNQLGDTTSKKTIWEIKDLNPNKSRLSFADLHRDKQQSKSMLLNNKMASEYPSQVIKPNANIEFEIHLSKDLAKQKLKFELAYGAKKLNPKIHIKEFKL